MANKKRTLLSIGECMLEFSRRADGLWNLGYAGDTLNTAWYFRALTRPESWDVEYLTRLGTDTHSDTITGFLENRGIGTRWIMRDPERQPGLYLIATENGERSFSYWRSQSAARRLADDEETLAMAIGQSDIIYLSGITLAILEPARRERLIALLRQARAEGRMTVFDPNIRPKLWENPDAMREMLTLAASAASLALPSFDDEKAWFGDASLEACAQRYLDASAEAVVVKNGGGPVCHSEAGLLTVISDLPRIDPVDSTGAGDSFNGAYLAALAAGQDSQTAIRSAHRVSCAVILKPGALVDPAELSQFRPG
ncbi:MAG: sugar kinase [Notoacmeibacter sp.]|nr:sugar kinase [Notoacmeibacter sp.]